MGSEIKRLSIPVTTENLEKLNSFDDFNDDSLLILGTVRDMLVGLVSVEVNWTICEMDKQSEGVETLVFVISNSMCGVYSDLELFPREINSYMPELQRLASLIDQAVLLTDLGCDEATFLPVDSPEAKADRIAVRRSRARRATLDMCSEMLNIFFYHINRIQEQPSKAA